MKRKLFLIVLFVFTGILITNAQKKLTILNPSFEDNKPVNSNYPGYAPPPWAIASVVNVAGGNCSVAPSPDMNPGVHGLLPDDKNFMMGAAANGDTNSNCHGGEAFYQVLCKPMMQGVQYSFNMRVMVTSFFPSPPANSIIDSAFFAVYGANAVPASNQFTNPEVLFKAKVNSTSWNTYTIIFTPVNASYTHLVIGAYARLGVQSGFNGVPYIQFDNITDVDSTCGFSIYARDTTICSGSCADIVVNSEEAVNPIQYSWNGSPFVLGDSARTGPNAFCDLTATQSFTVIAVDANNDTAQTVIKVNVQKPAIQALPKTSTICLNDSVQLHASGASSYSWSPPEGLDNSTVSNPVCMPTSTGTYNYMVTGTDILGCKNNDSAQVIVLSLIPTADAGSDQYICPERGDTAIILTATGGNIFIWSTGESTQSITVYPTETTTYTVVVGTICSTETAIDEVKVTVQCGIVIPNVITPNGDNDNQYFYIKGLEQYPDSRLEIFDRWGVKLYETSNYLNDWDGLNYRNNLPVSDGVYYYILYQSDEDKTIHKGFIQVMR